MIGKNVKLYDMVLQFLRTLFLRTRNVHYCTLRAELLMSLHDLDISEICSVDPCHKVSTQRVIAMLDHWELQTVYTHCVGCYFSFVFSLSSTTVHLVFRRMHP